MLLEGAGTGGIPVLGFGTGGIALRIGVGAGGGGIEPGAGTA